MNDFKERLIDEENELTERIVKLETFLTKNLDNKDIDSEQYTLMSMQLNAMKVYLKVLTMRINKLDVKK